MVATFSEELFFYNTLFQKSYYFTFISSATLPTYQSVIKSTCSLNEGVLSCVSIVAQSCVIDKVYLISWLRKVQWNCYWLRYFSTKHTKYYFLMMLPYEWATFLGSLLFKDPYCCFLEKLIFDCYSRFHSYTFYLSFSNQPY